MSTTDTHALTDEQIAKAACTHGLCTFVEDAGYRANALWFDGQLFDFAREIERAALALAQPAQPFPPRILTVLHELADRKGTPTHGPAEDANGEPLQDDADAALAWIASAQPAPQGWMTIESAPKDGSMILLGRPAVVGTDEVEECDGISLPGFWQEGWEDSIDDMGCDDGFVDCQFQQFSAPRSFGAEKYRSAGNQPTHWQPLPAAPTLPLAGDAPLQGEGE